MFQGHAQKNELDLDDVRLAIQSKVNGMFTQPPPRAGSLETGESGIFLQLGAFSSRDNAQSFVHRMRADVAWMGDSIHLYRSANLYKVHAGPYESQAAADRDASRVYQVLGISPFVVNR